MRSSSYPFLKLLTMLLPPILIGGAEFVRHEFWVDTLSMEAGNVLITVFVFALSLWYAEWMFRRIETSNTRLAEEEARRAVYEERERLAGELHDNIAQGLFFLNVKLQKGHTEEAKSAVTEINNHLRQAIFNLRTLPEETADFEGRLRRWLEEWSILAGIPCRIMIRIGDRPFSTSEEVQLFGLIQEAFTNIRKHSRAGQAELELLADREGWRLAVRDDGVGISLGMGTGTGAEEAGRVEEADKAYRADRAADVAGRVEKAAAGSVSANEARTAAGGGRYGLSLMAKRAEALQGTFRVASLEQGGTLVTVESRRKGGEG